MSCTPHQRKTLQAVRAGARTVIDIAMHGGQLPEGQVPDDVLEDLSHLQKHGFVTLDTSGHAMRVELTERGATHLEAMGTAERGFLLGYGRGDRSRSV